MATSVAGAGALSASPERAATVPPVRDHVLRGEAGPLARDARWGDAARSTICLWLFVLLIYLPRIVQAHRGEGVVSIALDCSTIVVSMLFCAPIFRLFRASLAWSLPARVAALGAAVVATAISQAAFDLLWTSWVANNLESSWRAMAHDLTRGYGAMINYVSVFAVNLALFQLAYNRRHGQRQERQLATMRAAGQQAELDALRFKLNPHFLFNTLNGISAMIVTKRLGEADEMVERLSAYLRASFGGDPAAPVTIEHELGLIEHYARIEELRFGDRLEVELGCAAQACDRTVPPLVVQRLVEHAIEAASRGDAPARIAVTAAVEQDRLCITIAHPHLTMPETIVEATRARVAGLAGATVTREDGATRLCLPAGPCGGEPTWEI